MLALAVALLAYLVGCFSTGYYLVRLRTGGDLRELGSGATGGRNAARVLGRTWLVLVAAGDIAKSVIAVGLPIWLGLGPIEVAAAMVGVSAGHIWPFQLGFRGGKGVSPFVGSIGVVAPVALVAGALVTGAAILVLRRPSLAGLAGAGATIGAALTLGQPAAIVLGIVVVVAFAALAHRSNLREEFRGAPAAGIELPAPTPANRSPSPSHARLASPGRLPFVGRWLAGSLPFGGPSDGR